MLRKSCEEKNWHDVKSIWSTYNASIVEVRRHLRASPITEKIGDRILRWDEIRPRPLLSLISLFLNLRSVRVPRDRMRERQWEPCTRSKTWGSEIDLWSLYQCLQLLWASWQHSMVAFAPPTLITFDDNGKIEVILFTICPLFLTWSPEWVVMCLDFFQNEERVCFELT